MRPRLNWMFDSTPQFRAHAGSPPQTGRGDCDSASTFADGYLPIQRSRSLRRARLPGDTAAPWPPALSTADVLRLLVENGPRVLTRIRQLTRRLAPMLYAEDLLAELTQQAFRCRLELARIPPESRPEWLMSNAERVFLRALRAAELQTVG